MSDSCKDSKVEPGLAARYSMLSVFNTSTIKSEPGRSITRSAAAGRTFPLSRARVFCPGAGAFPRAGCCARASFGFAAKVAAPTAAPFKNPRRPTVMFLDLPMAHSFGLRVSWESADCQRGAKGLVKPTVFWKVLFSPVEVRRRTPTLGVAGAQRRRPRGPGRGGGWRVLLESGETGLKPARARIDIRQDASGPGIRA